MWYRRYVLTWRYALFFVRLGCCLTFPFTFSLSVLSSNSFKESLVHLHWLRNFLVVHFFRSYVITIIGTCAMLSCCGSSVLEFCMFITNWTRCIYGIISLDPWCANRICCKLRYLLHSSERVVFVVLYCGKVVPCGVFRSAGSERLT